MRSLCGLALTASVLAFPAYATALRPLPVDCGTVTEHGDCDGATIRYCDTSVTPNLLVTRDCAAEFGVGAQCVDQPNGLHPICAAPIGGPCLRLDPAGVTMSIPCIGTVPACVEGPISSACTDMVGTCQATDIGSCRGDQLTLGCLDTQPWLLDCPAFGATCSGGLCVDATLGQVCGPNVRCAAPLVCGRLSRCEEPPDAGVSTTDAAVPPGPDSGSTEDARVQPVDAAPEPDSGATVAPDADPAPDAPAPVPAAPDAAGSGSGSDAGSAAADGAALDASGASECGCRSTGTGSPSALVLAVGLVLVLRRRRG